MSRDAVRDALRALPDVAARPGFTAAVLERLDAVAPAAAAPFGVRRPARAWATAVGLLLVVGAGLLGTVAERQAAREQRLAAVREESAALRRELESVRQQLQTPPLFYLGGNERVDVVLDLDRFAHDVAAAPAAGDSRAATGSAKTST